MDEVFDTSTIDAPERLDAFKDAFFGRAPQAALGLYADGDKTPHGHIESGALGGTAAMVSYHTTGHSILRSPTHVRRFGPERICLTVTSAGRWDSSQHGTELQVDSALPQLLLTDFTAPFSCARYGFGTSDMYLVDFDELGLGVDVVRRSMYRLKASPVHDAVMRQLSSLARTAGGLPEAARPHFASSTLHLVRALLATAADADTRLARETMAEALLSRVQVYLESKLRDPDLSPAMIAAAHHVSVRRLYQVWEGQPLGLGDWILAQRLELAARELLRPGPPVLVASIARRCGFRDAAGFSRRFRARYGVTPRQWRELHS